MCSTSWPKNILAYDCEYLIIHLFNHLFWVLKRFGSNDNEKFIMYRRTYSFLFLNLANWKFKLLQK